MRRDIMRGGICCLIVEAFPGSLSGLAELLAGWNVRTRLLAASAVSKLADEEPVDLHLVDTGSHAGLGVLRALIGRRRVGGEPVIALCRRDSPTAVSQALALACDDALAFPLEDVELEARIAALAAYVFAARERTRRQALLERYRPAEASRPRSGAGRPLRDERAKVLLAGIACENQVKVAHGIGPAATAYADSTRAACRMIAERPFDLIVATLPGPGTTPVLLPAEVGAAGGAQTACLLLAGPLENAANIKAALDVGFHDVLNLPQPPELIRLRVEFWLRLQRLRRWLRDPLSGAATMLALDAMSGLFNQGFMLDYIDAVLAERAGSGSLALLALALTGLPEINRRQGHATGNRRIAEAGQRLRNLVRAEDMAAHQGSGQFVIVMDGTSEREAVAVSERVQASLRRADVEASTQRLPLDALSSVVMLRRRDEVDRHLARAFREHWASRPHVA